MPRGCHSLNLTLCDMVNCCVKAISFFGVVQRIYCVFANSIKYWKILQDHVDGLTLKTLSTTCWESRVESVKAIRSQATQIKEPLFKVAETGEDAKVKSEAKSLATHELENFEFLLGMIFC